VSADDVAAGNAEPAADRLEDRDQIRVQAAVAPHEDPQIITQRGLARGKDPGHFPDLSEVQLAEPDGGAGIKVCKTGFHLIET